ncbi:hypothetical protein HIM_07825 [Hirsutella minnesotensis 3608]|uniref:Uncharacterized protein n=1 Tax=Hirsutella minnesotensis 3608 TaxID=1043627 RepID=A0A0F7ZMX3_9HYPO|nr:hypothetical protein HIM_07825 [Hirsutella minnesotensis 3608]
MCVVEVAGRHAYVQRRKQTSIQSRRWATACQFRSERDIDAEQAEIRPSGCDELKPAFTRCIRNKRQCSGYRRSAEAESGPENAATLARAAKFITYGGVKAEYATVASLCD